VGQQYVRLFVSHSASYLDLDFAVEPTEVPMYILKHSYAISICNYLWNISSPTSTGYKRSACEPCQGACLLSGSLRAGHSKPDLANVKGIFHGTMMSCVEPVAFL
jgi:hypothetical protein